MSNLNKILNLIRKTGDKFVIMNEDGQDFVVMLFKDYERIVEGQSQVKNLSEQELWDKVDRDINLWKEEHEEDEFDFEPEPLPPMTEPWEEPLVKPYPFENEEFEEFEEEDEDWKNPLRDEGFDFFDESEKTKEKGEIENEEDEFADEDIWSDEEIKEKTVGDALEFIEEKEDKKGKARFAIPKERLSREFKIKDELAKEIEEPIKYEDIPPPPDIEINDLMDMEDKKPIIDASFEEDEEFDDDEEVFFEE